MDLPTRLDLFAIGRDYVIQRATRIDPDQVDIEGSDVNLIVGVSSVLSAQVMNQLAYRIAALYLDSAEGEDLDRYALDRYGIARKGASPALGTVRLFRTTVTGGAGSIPIGTKLFTNTGFEYITTTNASFGVGDFSSSADVRAVQAGKVTQVGANSIVRFSNPAGLFDKTMQVNNDDVTAGGEDAEDDETFRARIRDFWRTARRGILAAIEFGALAVPGVVSAQAVEVLSEGNPGRAVNLYISDSSGVASNALARQVQISLEDYRAAGITVLVSNSLPLTVAVQLALSFQAGVDTLTLTDNIRSAIVEFINSLPVNGTLYRAELASVLSRYREDGLIPSDSTLVAPTGDLEPVVGQTIRTTLASVTVV